MKIFYALIFIILAVSTADTAFSQKDIQTKNTVYWGLNTTTVDSPEGKVNIHLPDDIAAGDTISGTVIAEPYGTSPYEINENSDVLNGYVVEVKTPKKTIKKSKVGVNKIAKIVVPAGVATALTLVLKNNKGKTVSKSSIPVNPTTSVIDKPKDFTVPEIGQTGRPVEIPGPFDGSLDTTSVKIGGKKSPVLAESPRKAVAQTPRDVVGQVDMELKERNKVTKGKINMLAIKLSAPKTTLLRGEETTITAQVVGLEGLPRDSYPVPFEITNLTPQVIRFLNKPDVSVSTGIKAEQVDGGIWTELIPVVGVNPGHFSVAAKVFYVSIHNTKKNMNLQEFLDWLAAVKTMWQQEVDEINKEEKAVTKKGEKWPDTAEARGRELKRNLLKEKIRQLEAARLAADGQLDIAKQLADKILADVTLVELGAELVGFASDLLGYQDIPMIKVSTVLKGLGAVFKAPKIASAISAAEKTAKAYEKLKEGKEKAEKLKELNEKVKKVKKLIEEQ